MPRMSDKRKLELAFFLTESGRVAYNKLCLCCKHECKQSYRAVVVQCGRFEKRREQRFSQTQRGPRKGEWPLWGKEKPRHSWYFPLAGNIVL